MPRGGCGTCSAGRDRTGRGNPRGRGSALVVLGHRVCGVQGAPAPESCGCRGSRQMSEPAPEVHACREQFNILRASFWSTSLGERNHKRQKLSLFILVFVCMVVTKVPEMQQNTPNCSDRAQNERTGVGNGR